MPDFAGHRMLDMTLRRPVFVLAAAFLIAPGFRTERRIQLGAFRAAQEPALQQGQKVRAQLDQLADATARLAAAGDANAKAIVDDMARHGVTLRPRS